MIYWLGDSTGVLLVTPLVFTLPGLLRLRSRPRIIELATLLTLLTGACLVIFGDLPLIPIRLHALAFAVLPFVIWGAIAFGIAGAALSVFLIASIATVLTAFGSGPFATSTPFVNAALLDVLFAVLAVSGLTLAAVITEREKAETHRDQHKRVGDALSSVNRKLIEAQEKERARIARELHDDIGQRLALLTVKLTGLALSSPEVGSDRSQAIELQKFASSLAQDVQALSHELHSSKVGILGAAPACACFAPSLPVSRASRSTSTARTCRQISVQTFRCACIAFFRKRCTTPRSTVGDSNSMCALWTTRRHVHLEVHDDGVGFDVQKARESSGLGLVSMEERVKLVAGELAIASTPQRGTTVHARVPLN